MLTEGQLIGNYRIVRKMGEGGMGAVYEALHEQINKRAAVKVLHPQLAVMPEIATRFLNEARAVNIVQHPGMVGIFEYGKLPDGTVYIIMEYLQGQTLTARIAAGRMPLSDALRLSRQIASALAAAHAKNIVHRDLKPDNVMIVPDPEAAAGERVKILDFGIAKVAAESQGPGEHVKTRTGAVLGTPAYMSPEQCQGASGVDAKSDVYSLGIILYEMLGGTVPFVAEGLGTLMAMHLFQQPRPLQELAPSVPAALAALVHATLAKAPAERPAMAQVVEELERLGALRTSGMPVADLPRGAETVPDGAWRPRQPSLAPPAQTPAPTQTPPPVSAPMTIPPRPSTLGGATGEAQGSPGPQPVQPPPGRPVPVALIGVTGVALLALAAGGIALQRMRASAPVTLRIQRVGEGGAVVSDPAGVYCGDLCSHDFPAGAIVTLTPRLEEGGTFAGWSGACSGDGPCGVALSRPLQVEARFHKGGAAGPCQPGGFCPQEAPARAADRALETVWAASSRDVWAAGSGGTILHYDGRAWSEAPSGTAEAIHGLWGSGPRELFAVGDGGTILHYDGSGFTRLPGPAGVTLHGVWGRGPQDVFAVGDRGTILHYDGRAFAPVKHSGRAGALFAVAAWGPEVWAVGQGGLVLREDPRRGSWTSVRSPSTRNLQGVAVHGMSEVWIVGQAGTVLRYDGSRLSLVPSGTLKDLHALCLDGAGVYAGGDEGTILRYDGRGFAPVRSGTLREVLGLAAGSGEVFGVGRLATILRLSGK